MTAPLRTSLRIDGDSSAYDRAPTDAFKRPLSAQRRNASTKKQNSISFRRPVPISELLIDNAIAFMGNRIGRIGAVLGPASLTDLTEGLKDTLISYRKKIRAGR